MMSKKILITAGTIIGIAAISIGAVFALQSMNTAEPETPEVVVQQEFKADISKDYGACTLLEKDFIKQVLGSVADNLQGPDNYGVFTSTEVVADGQELTTESQSCMYGFEPGGTFENGYNGTNGITITITNYASEADTRLATDEVRSNDLAEGVSEIGPDAFYIATLAPKEIGGTGIGATDTYEIKTFSDKSVTRYLITQPKDSKTFTTESAKAILLNLAQEK